MNQKHGMVGTPEYRSWAMMKVRCTNPRNQAYPRYGGRGIVICDRWMSFINFYADMGPRPSVAHSLDRSPNNNGNYEPGNCRWATNSEQGRNKRSNALLAFKGKIHCITEWASITGVKRRTIQARLAKGWTIERTLTEPVMTLSESGRIGGIARHA